MSGKALVLGVRHHGPGSARSVLAALEAARPDVLLVEGPEEAEQILPFLQDAKPPVAMLFYDIEQPRRALFYPLAEFSPELQAIRWAQQNGVPVQFIDLPASAVLNLRADRRREGDPLSRLAEAAGFEDVEDWWEHLVEHRRDTESLFEGLESLMAELRQEPIPPVDEEEEEAWPEEDEESDTRPRIPHKEYEQLREDHMRRAVDAAGPNAAVVCGAWHAPALRTKPGPKTKLSKVKVGATLVPWTYDRLTFASGYGAGANSPAFYEMLWETPTEEVTRRWLISVARLLRAEDLEASSANVIEAVRLAEALASLRGRPRPGLRELQEAANSVLVRDEVVWRVIKRRLMVGERMGEVPEATPAVPLQVDLRSLQRRLRMPVDESDRKLELDLRNDNDRQRSHLLHRLLLLDIQWGASERVGGGKKGTFHEHWRIQWAPALAIAVIEASPWGNTVEAAATARATSLANGARELREIAALVERILLADLAQAIEPSVQRLLDLSATAADVGDLADALPPLVAALRYGSVRKVETDRLQPVIDAIFTRLCLGLAGACNSLDDEAAGAMSRRLSETAAVANLLDDEAKTGLWLDALRNIVHRAGAHARVVGRAERLRFDAGAISGEELAERLGREASVGAPAAETAAFVEGMLEGSGTLLLHQDALWHAVNDWVISLDTDAFHETLPLIRRTFALFSRAERRQLGERAAGGTVTSRAQDDIDHDRAELVLPVIRRVLGL